MSYEIAVLDVTFPASGDLSGSQYRCASLTTAGQLQVMTSFLDTFVGVLQDKTTAAGISAKVRVEGITKVIAGGTSGLEMAILCGHTLVSTGGAVIPSSSGAGNRIVGQALQNLSTFSASTANVPTITMLIHRSGVST